MNRRQMQQLLRLLALQRDTVPAVLLDATGHLCGFVATASDVTMTLSVGADTPVVSVPLLRGAVERLLRAVPAAAVITISGTPSAAATWTLTMQAGAQEESWAGSAAPAPGGVGMGAQSGASGSVVPQVLKDTLQRVLPIPLSDQDAPPACRSIRLESHSGQAALLATDGHRLVSCPLPLARQGDVSCAAALPVRAARQLLAVLTAAAHAPACSLGPSGADPVVLCAAPEAAPPHVTFLWGTLAFRVRTLACPFPNYEQFIPPAAPAVTVERAALLAALAEIEGYLARQKSRAAATVLYAQAAAGAFTVWAGTRHEPLPMATRTLAASGADHTVIGGGFTLADMRGIVQAVRAPRLVLAANGEYSLWLVRSSDPAEPYLGLIMPAA